MSYARQVLDSYPRASGLDAGVLATTIDALTDCAQACTADVDANLSEQDLAEMVKCIRLCLNCADVCTATAGRAGLPEASGHHEITDRASWRSRRTVPVPVTG